MSDSATNENVQVPEILGTVESPDVLYDPTNPADSLKRALVAADIGFRQNLTERVKRDGQLNYYEWKFTSDGDWATDTNDEHVVRKHITSRLYQARPSGEVKRAKRSTRTSLGHVERKLDQLAEDRSTVKRKLRALRDVGFDSADPTVAALTAQSVKLKQKRAQQRAESKRLTSELIRLEADTTEDRVPVNLSNRAWAKAIGELMNDHGYEPDTQDETTQGEQS